MYYQIADNEAVAPLVLTWKFLIDTTWVRTDRKIADGELRDIVFLNTFKANIPEPGSDAENQQLRVAVTAYKNLFDGALDRFFPYYFLENGKLPQCKKHGFATILRVFQEFMEKSEGYASYQVEALQKGCKTFPDICSEASDNYFNKIKEVYPEYSSDFGNCIDFAQADYIGSRLVFKKDLIKADSGRALTPAQVSSEPYKKFDSSTNGDLKPDSVYIKVRCYALDEVVSIYDIFVFRFVSFEIFHY